MITIEDANEITFPQVNRIHFILSRTEQTNDFNYARLLDLIVRMTDNASVLLKMIETGHDHFYTTIHAESVEATYAVFADRILQITKLKI